MCIKDNGKYAIEEPNSTYIYFPSNMSPGDLVWANAKGRTKTNERVKFTFSHASVSYTHLDQLPVDKSMVPFM